MSIHNNKISYIKSLTCGLLILLCTSITYGQLKNFGTNAKCKPEPNYIHSIYSYYDVFGQIGLGYQHQIINISSIDFSIYKLNNNHFIKNGISQDDYYDYEGYGISITPKFMFSQLNRFYIGGNIGIQSMSHGSVKWEHYSGSGDPRYYYNEERKGYGITGGFVIGNKVLIKKIFFEPYLCAGLSTVEYSYTSYSNYRNGIKNTTLPINGNENQTYLHANIGLKVGFSFKKNKQHEILDKKFDEVHNPKIEALLNDISAKDFKKNSTRFFLIAAKKNTQSINRKLLRIYKRKYEDTALIYSKVNLEIHDIYELIKMSEKNDSIHGQKADSLMNYFNTMSFMKKYGSIYLTAAYRKTKRLNANTLGLFYRFKNNEPLLYYKINLLYSQIDKFIIKGNQQK